VIEKNYFIMKEAGHYPINYTKDYLLMLRKLFEGIGWKVINPFSESSYGSR